MWTSLGSFLVIMPVIIIADAAGIDEPMKQCVLAFPILIGIWLIHKP